MAQHHKTINGHESFEDHYRIAVLHSLDEAVQELRVGHFWRHATFDQKVQVFPFALHMLLCCSFDYCPGNHISSYDAFG